MKTLLVRIAALSLMLVPAVSQAARAWLLPSQTILARSGGWVAVDAAMADDLFSFNQGAMPIDSLVVSGPDGQPVAPQNPAKSHTRSSFDLELRQAGTYRVAVVDDGVTARWEEDGKPKRWRGTAAEMATGIPANATKLEVEQTQRRVETFVSVGSPTDVKATAGSGIELSPVQHPNDLYARETAKFRFLLDGKPAKDLEVEVIAGGTRYRDAPDAMTFKTSKDGEIAITWPAAGMYWLELSLADEHATVPGVKSRRASYAATFEVLSQ
ncbi:MAG TPA: DUF4198 domain-containing protein [Steroidobacteraceae bacterium]|jgi:uncharacterized GH25 family protein|nr:DUF4198 domain-containing protein [Steroidobacteraceae bacterium]